MAKLEEVLAQELAEVKNDMELNDQFTILTAIAGIITGFFALVRYIVSKVGGMHKELLDHLEKKNGIIERISKEFSHTLSETMRENNLAINGMKKSVDELNLSLVKKKLK